jgi:hypothetical protein
VEEAGLDEPRLSSAEPDRIEHTQDEALFGEPGSNPSVNAPLALYRRTAQTPSRKSSVKTMSQSHCSGR